MLSPISLNHWFQPSNSQEEDLRVVVSLKLNEQLEDQLKQIINKRDSLDCKNVIPSSMACSRDCMAALRFIAVVLSSITSFVLVGPVPKFIKK